MNELIRASVRRDVMMEMIVSKNIVHEGATIVIDRTMMISDGTTEGSDPATMGATVPMRTERTILLKEVKVIVSMLKVRMVVKRECGTAQGGQDRNGGMEIRNIVDRLTAKSKPLMVMLKLVETMAVTSLTVNQNDVQFLLYSCYLVNWQSITFFCFCLYLHI